MRPVSHPGIVRTTVSIDDALLVRAAELSGIESRSELLNTALSALIQL